jgi:hypothetical protein
MMQWSKSKGQQDKQGPAKDNTTQKSRGWTQGRLKTILKLCIFNVYRFVYTLLHSTLTCQKLIKKRVRKSQIFVTDMSTNRLNNDWVGWCFGI